MDMSGTAIPQGGYHDSLCAQGHHIFSNLTGVTVRNTFLHYSDEGALLDGFARQTSEPTKVVARQIFEERRAYSDRTTTDTSGPEDGHDESTAPLGTHTNSPSDTPPHNEAHHPFSCDQPFWEQTFFRSTNNSVDTRRSAHQYPSFGWPIQEALQVQRAPMRLRFCPECGSEAHYQHRFCPFCRFELQQLVNSKPESNLPTVSKGMPSMVMFAPHPTQNLLGHVSQMRFLDLPNTDVIAALMKLQDHSNGYGHSFGGENPFSPMTVNTKEMMTNVGANRTEKDPNSRNQRRGEVRKTVDMSPQMIVCPVHPSGAGVDDFSRRSSCTSVAGSDGPEMTHGPHVPMGYKQLFGIC